MTLSLRFIMMSMVLCCGVSCSQNDEPQANAQSVSQATRVDGESAGEPSSLAESRDEMPQITSSDSSLTIFEKRILPIFQSAKPSSCAECHLSGVDLKEYIRPSQQQTFASLVSAGLIDVAKPDESKILTFINRRPEQPSLVTDEIRQVEFEAFRAWVRAAVSDSTLIANKDVQPIGPQLSEEVIRHARKDRVLASFVENVWTEVGRCAACHSPDQNQKQVKEHGEQVSWITLRDPQATLNYMLEADLIETSFE